MFYQVQLTSTHTNTFCEASNSFLCLFFFVPVVRFILLSMEEANKRNDSYAIRTLHANETERFWDAIHADIHSMQTSILFFFFFSLSFLCKFYILLDDTNWVKKKCNVTLHIADSMNKSNKWSFCHRQYLSSENREEDRKR